MVQSGAITLNDIEKTELAQLEAVIERGLQTFEEVGAALLAIRDQRLYRAEYGTFEEYCRERWNIHRSRAYQLMDAAQIAENLSTSVDKPLTEREIRPLRVLNQEQQREAWQRAVETAPDGKITAGHVQRVVDEMTPESYEVEDDYPQSIDPFPPESKPITPRLAVHFSSDSPEHYTPQVIIDATVDCLGAIDLDPCSNSHDHPTIPAQRHFTIGDDGLAQEWYGRVYMNPPYGRAISAWVEKLDHEHTAHRVIEAIALVPARTDTQWWQVLRDYAVCFIEGRLKFSGDGNDESAPFPSAVFYLGDNIGKFYYSFSHLGDIYQRLEPHMFGV
jgi:hypothetical protein